MPTSNNRLLRSRDIGLLGNRIVATSVRDPRVTFHIENVLASRSRSETNYVISHRKNESRILKDRNCTEGENSNMMANFSRPKGDDCSVNKTNREQTSAANAIPTRKRASLIAMSGLSTKYPMLEHKDLPVLKRTEQISHLEISQQAGFTLKEGYVCKFCGAKCKNKEDLRKHLSFRHSGDGFYTCTICSERLPSYFSMFSVEQHMLAHKSVKGFSCSICNKRFRYERSLRNHVSIHAAPMDSFQDLDSFQESTTVKFVHTDINGNVAIAKEFSVPPPVENPFFEAIGLKPRKWQVNYVDTDENGPTDVISDTGALRTFMLGLPNATHLQIDQVRYKETAGDHLPTLQRRLAKCKSCVVNLIDMRNVYGWGSKTFKCTGCGKKFYTTDKLHLHIVETCHKASNKLSEYIKNSSCLHKGELRSCPSDLDRPTRRLQSFAKQHLIM